ncbi:1504_t:CDS:1, partial [Ambispora gerdemannii]
TFWIDCYYVNYDSFQTDGASKSVLNNDNFPIPKFVITENEDLQTYGGLIDVTEKALEILKRPTA